MPRFCESYLIVKDNNQQFPLITCES